MPLLLFLNFLLFKCRPEDTLLIELHRCDTEEDVKALYLSTQREKEKFVNFPNQSVSER